MQKRKLGQGLDVPALSPGDGKATMPAEGARTPDEMVRHVGL